MSDFDQHNISNFQKAFQRKVHQFNDLESDRIMNDSINDSERYKSQMTTTNFILNKQTIENSSTMNTHDEN